MSTRGIWTELVEKGKLVNWYSELIGRHKRDAFAGREIAWSRSSLSMGVKLALIWGCHSVSNCNWKYLGSLYEERRQIYLGCVLVGS